MLMASQLLQFSTDILSVFILLSLIILDIKLLEKAGENSTGGFLICCTEQCPHTHIHVPTARRLFDHRPTAIAFASWTSLNLLLEREELKMK
jgi:hypothetical protein